MSRIALQIFLAFFVSLITMATVATGITAWSLQKQESLLQTQIRQHAADAAQALAADGTNGLIDWARAQERVADDWVMLVFDEWGEEILGRERPVTAAVSRSVLSPWLDAAVITLDLGRDTPVLINEFGERYQLIPVPVTESHGLFGLLGQPRIVMSLILVFITLPISWWLARFVTRPILDLQTTLQRLSDGHLEARVPTRTAQRQDELGQLARALDDMTTKLDDLITSRERLLRDISHELRSPLARMRLAIALLEQAQFPAAARTDTHARDLDRPEEIKRIEREITKLDDLIGNILDLSRLDDLAADRRSEDLFPWLERALQDAQFEAQQAGKTLRCDWPKAALIIHGSVEWCAAAFENVLRNAIRHTPAGGLITVNASWKAQGLSVQVFNEGSLIPDEYLAKIFEPFFRADTDRSRRSGGTGLGLAIAARVMQAHGGSIRASNRSATADQAAGVQIDLFWPQLTDTKL